MALGGVPAIIVGRTLDSCRHGLRMARKALLVLEENKISPVDRINWALENITESTELEESARTADLVIESGPEDMAFKQDLFCQLDEWAPPEATLATNTSGLGVSAIASAAKNDPGRVVTTHFWNPPHLMPLVEVVQGARTRDEVVAKFRELLRRAARSQSS